MPIIRSKKRINPLDLNKNVRIGVAFPLNKTNMFSGTKTVKEQIKANLLNLLLTYPGERINLPNYGIGLKNLVFEQKIELEDLKTNIQDQIKVYIPGVTLQNVFTSLSEDRHILSISLIYTYDLDNTQQQIQINFN